MRELLAMSAAVLEQNLRTPSAKRKYKSVYIDLANTVQAEGLRQEVLDLYGAVPRFGLTFHHVERAVGRSTNILCVEVDSNEIARGLQNSVRITRNGRNR